MKVVVLGASGNAGTAVLRALEAEPEVQDIVAVARRPPAEWPSPKTTWRSLDIAADPLVALLRGADAVVHLAWLIQPARDQERCHAVNVGGSERVVAAVAEARVGALVHASSVGAYARGPKDRLVDESWPTGGTPSSFYARHKAAVERLLDRLEAERPEVRVVLAPGLDLPARGGLGDPAPDRGAVRARSPGLAEVDPARSAPPASARPGRARR
jgi:nucleoside-diphosphate-sugar epimerase